MFEQDQPHDSPETHAAGGDHDHGGIAKYLVVFVLLCLLTAGSFMTYFPFWHDHLPIEVSRAFMMAISCAKATLVVAFFMHLKWEANWKWVLTVPASFMSIFLLLMLVPDIGRRQDNGYSHYSYERWLYAADPQSPHGDETSGHPDDGAAEK